MATAYGTTVPHSSRPTEASRRNVPESQDKNGADDPTRTDDLLITSELTNVNTACAPGLRRSLPIPLQYPTYWKD